jgi:hypothetical protein
VLLRPSRFVRIVPPDRPAPSPVPLPREAARAPPRDLRHRRLAHPPRHPPENRQGVAKVTRLTNRTTIPETFLQEDRILLELGLFPGVSLGRVRLPVRPLLLHQELQPVARRRLFQARRRGPTDEPGIETGTLMHERSGFNAGASRTIMGSTCTNRTTRRTKTPST